MCYEYIRVSKFVKPERWNRRNVDFDRCCVPRYSCVGLQNRGGENLFWGKKEKKKKLVVRKGTLSKQRLLPSKKTALSLVTHSQSRNNEKGQRNSLRVRNSTTVGERKRLKIKVKINLLMTETARTTSVKRSRQPSILPLRHV